jgi:hypothetical protein
VALFTASALKINCVTVAYAGMARSTSKNERSGGYNIPRAAIFNKRNCAGRQIVRKS